MYTNSIEFRALIWIDGHLGQGVLKLLQVCGIDMTRRLSLSGFCIKDLFHALDCAFAERDLERAC